jgi:hypothetical protein
MGTRSDVAVCMKSELFSKLPKEILVWMKAESSSILEHPDGVMFVFEDVKWYAGCDGDIDDLYRFLESDAGDEEEHLVVTACSEYPESTDGCSGDWTDNPWNVYKEVSVSLNYEET